MLLKFDSFEIDRWISKQIRLMSRQNKWTAHFANQSHITLIA